MTVFPALAYDAAPEGAADYIPPPMFDDAPPSGNITRPEDYAAPGDTPPTQIIEHTRLYTMRSASPAVSIGAVLAPVREMTPDAPSSAGFQTPPLPLDRPARFAVSRAYADSLIRASSGSGKALPPAHLPTHLKVKPMDARDVLESLE